MSEDRRVVPFVRARLRPDPARVREFAATARKLQREREASGDLVARLLRTLPRDEWARLASEEALRNSGALERLSDEVEARLDSAPLDALAISNVAAALAETIAPDAYPAVVIAQMRAHAWKDRGQALATLAQYDEAIAALLRAEELLAPFGTLAHDLALVRYVRATTLQYLQQFDDSLDLLTDCREVFSDHGDARRVLLCGIAEGDLLQRLGRYREARHAYAALLVTARELGNRDYEACLHNNMAHAAMELGDYTTAELQLAEAHALFVALGQPVRALKTEAVAALVLARRGDVAAAAARLRETRRRFLMHGLVEEAGICGLEVVQLLLDSDAAEAEELARDIVAEFEASRLSARAVTALGYLAEAIAARDASPQTVVRVRDYIRALHRDPEREFVVTQRVS